MRSFNYALGVHMHQPPENLRLLIESNEWEAQQIIACYDRCARYAHKYPDLGAFQVGFSGVLLEQLLDKKIVDQYRKFVDIPEMLDLYRTADNVELIGMGHFHPLFPILPTEDWPDQLTMGRQIAEEVFGRMPQGFWPSEMAFSMEMVPYLVDTGYRFVVVDHVHVKPLSKSTRLDPFRPYLAEHDGKQITIIPRHRDISNAQESGLNPEWFLTESAHKLSEVQDKTSSPLLTTWSDGENGGWFRQMAEESGFWGFFYGPLIEKIAANECSITLTKLSDYLAKTRATEKVHVATGAWNVASTSGYDFSQWNGSLSQKKAVERLFEASKNYWQKAAKQTSPSETLNRARRILLEAETSCYLFWGDAWLPQLHEKLDEVNALLG